jgi:hypothetical protein
MYESSYSDGSYAKLLSWQQAHVVIFGANNWHNATERALESSCSTQTHLYFFVANVTAIYTQEKCKRRWRRVWQNQRQMIVSRTYFN